MAAKKDSADSAIAKKAAEQKVAREAAKKEKERKAAEAEAAEKAAAKAEAKKAAEEADKLKQLEALVRAQAETIEQLKGEIQKGTTINLAAVPAEERVVFLWQAPVADYNEITFGVNGRYGRIVGPTGTFFVPKSELSQVLDAPTRHYIDIRWLIVLSGLDEQEREMLGCNYKKGEYLSKDAFMKVADMGDDILDIYPGLCKSHKDIVAKFYFEAWREGKDLKRETVIKLNKLSGSEAFKTIIEEMNARDLTE